MDFTSDKPIYRQIIDFSFGQILTGEWKAGERIPSVRELSVRLSVNSHTALKAYDYLQSEGIIVPRRGLGFFLSDNAVEQVNQARRHEFFDITLKRLFNEMDLLGISIEEVVEKYHNESVS